MCFRQLKEGTLEENELTDGSRLTLLPIVETGLTVSTNFGAEARIYGAA